MHPFSTTRDRYHTHLHNGGNSGYHTKNTLTKQTPHLPIHRMHIHRITISNSTTPQIRNQRICQKNHQERSNSMLLYNHLMRHREIQSQPAQTKQNHSTLLHQRLQHNAYKPGKSFRRHQQVHTRNKQIPPHVHTLLPHRHKKTPGQANKILLQILLWPSVGRGTRDNTN